MKLLINPISLISFIKHKRFLNSLGHADPSAEVCTPSLCNIPSKLFIYEHVRLGPLSKFIVGESANKGVFIAKKYCSIGAGLTVVTNNHATANARIGEWFTANAIQGIGDSDADVEIGEDCSLGSNVTILPGVKVGRGAVVGSGAVLRNNIPPYAIVIGNPAKVVGFKFSVEEIIEHEKKLFPANERLEESLLKMNYQKFFLNKLDEIKSFVSLKF